MDNKKTLMLSVIGVLVLIVVVVGVSYAMYSFTGTGTKENVITTGSISVVVDPTQDPVTGGALSDQTQIKLTNQYAMTDGTGSAITPVEGESALLKFYVAATLNGNTTINYEIGITKNACTETTDGGVTYGCLQDSEVNFNLKKGTEYLPGKGTESTGVAFSTIAGAEGNLGKTNNAEGRIANYLLDADSFNASGLKTYELRAWVNDKYVLPTKDTSNEAGTVHSNESLSEKYEFKIKLYAEQVA